MRWKGASPGVPGTFLPRRSGLENVHIEREIAGVGSGSGTRWHWGVGWGVSTGLFEPYPSTVAQVTSSQP